jgi:hypothetical protein
MIARIGKPMRSSREPRTGKISSGGLLAVLALLMAASAQAQSRNEIGLVMGATLTPSRALASGSATDLTLDASLAMGAEYDLRIASGNRIAVYLGGDFLASPLDVKLSQPPTGIIPEYAYAFLTGHVRAKFSPEGALQPWLMLGGGYARFLEAAPAGVTGFQRGTNTGTLVFGGGLDTPTVIRPLGVPVGFRVELRDFYSGSPNYGQRIRGGRQHNVAFTGGLLIRF